MVFPISDDNSDRTTTPVVNYILIAINVFVFVVPQGLGQNDQFTFAYSTVPEEIWTGKDVVGVHEIADPLTGRLIGKIDLQPTPIPVYLTLLTSMFMHGSIMHIAGNMWFLWIFGDNIENYLGHVRYAAFYLVCGILAGVAHVMATFASNGDPYIPSLGASGAISGVMGGYILLFPFRRVTVILFRILTQVPAWVAVGIWFAFQLISGVGVLGGGAQAGGGVAYGAHVGGFIAGVLLIKVFGLGLPTEGGWPPRSPDRRGRDRWENEGPSYRDL